MAIIPYLYEKSFKVLNSVVIKICANKLIYKYANSMIRLYGL